MNCPHCGQPVEAGATFCGNCGQALAAAATPAQPITTPMPQPVNTVSPAPNYAPQSVQPAVAPYNMSTQTPISMPTPFQPAAVAESPGEKKAITALILGVVALPGSLIPLLGLVLGITAIILGSTARRQYRHLMSLLAIIFGAIAILISIALFVYVVQHDPKLHHSTTKSTSSSSSNGVSGSSKASLRDLTSVCYSTKLDSGFDNYTPTDCDIESTNDTQFLDITSQALSSVNTSNFEVFSKEAVKGAANSLGGQITSQQSTKFAGSQAYLAIVSAPKAGKTITAALYLIYHPISRGQNIFTITAASTGDPKTFLTTVESNWQWE